MRFHTQTGVAAVEFALILVPMLLLCLGVAELGRALFQYEGVVKATRGAARYLTQQNLSDPSSDTYKEAVAAAKSLALCGKRSCSDSDPRLVSGLEAESQVSVATYPNVPTGEGTASLVSVTIQDVKFTSVIPGLSSALGYGEWLNDIIFSPIKITMAYSTT